MRCVTYNVHYGIGLDGRYEIARLADAVRGADVIALQEVSRGNPFNGSRDMAAELRDALPDYFAAYGSNFEVDMGSAVEKGRAVDRTFSLGNMVLSRTPIVASRNLLLPRSRSFEKMNFQRGALEALVQTPFGFVRFYSVHLDHRGADERLKQIRFLKDRMINYPIEGGALTGVAEMNMPEPPVTDAFVALGDFNMLEGSLEHAELCGRPDKEFGMPVVANLAVDAAQRLGRAGEDDTTHVNPENPGDRSRWKRIDYAFASASLAPRLKDIRVDRSAVGSDHFPVWVELG